MTKRLKSLRRIETVQTRLVALADLQLAQAERRYRELVEKQQRLRDFIGQTDALSAPLTKATLRAAHAVETRLVEADASRIAATARRDACKRREHAVSEMTERETVVARRAEGDKELAEILDAWLAREGASLP